MVRSASLRASLRRAEGTFLSSLPSTYEPACARAPTLARRSWATFVRPIGLFFFGSNIFIPLGGAASQEGTQRRFRLQRNAK
jgi:hypothetical protein